MVGVIIVAAYYFGWVIFLSIEIAYRCVEYPYDMILLGCMMADFMALIYIDDPYKTNKAKYVSWAVCLVVIILSIIIDELEWSMIYVVPTFIFHMYCALYGLSVEDK